MKSHKIVIERLQKMVKAVVTEAEDVGAEGTLKFENLGAIFHNLGVFQSIGFNKSSRHNQSTLTINKLNAKPEVLSNEVNNALKFHLANDYLH